ncbi:hypothetical protein [Nocardioides pacificus]
MSGGPVGDAFDRALDTADAPEEVLADKYDEMLRLADLFESAGDRLRERSRLGDEVLTDESLVASAPLSATTFTRVEEDVRAATTGRHGLTERAAELDADALVVRATVRTYRWIDDLQEAAFRTLGTIAGRAVGYLAPEVALGGAIVSAGLIETDALDRDEVASYLEELADNNPELLDHLASGGGLLDSLQMRSLLTTSVLAGDEGPLAARGGLRALGVDPLTTDGAAALRDAAGGFATDAPAPTPTAAVDMRGDEAPHGFEEIMRVLAAEDGQIRIQQVDDARFIAWIPGLALSSGRPRLRLVGGDPSTYVVEVVRALETAIGDRPDARVMLVGLGQGGVTAADVAAGDASEAFVIDQVVTAGAPSSQVPRIPPTTRVLSFEDRRDPIALLGSLINTTIPNRVTVVFDGAEADEDGPYVAGGRAADASEHPLLRAEGERLRELGYLAP